MFVYISQHLCPGAVKTEFLDAGGWEQKLSYDSIPHLEPDQVANAVRYILDTPPGTQVSKLTLLNENMRSTHLNVSLSLHHVVISKVSCVSVNAYTERNKSETPYTHTHTYSFLVYINGIGD